MNSRRNYPLTIGVALLAIFVLALLFSENLARDPYVCETMRIDRSGETVQFQKPPYAPTWQQPLGSDEWGRDLLGRVMYGTRFTFLFAAGILAARLAIAFPLALVAALRGRIASRLIDQTYLTFTSLPSLLFAIIVLKLPLLGQRPMGQSVAIFIAIAAITEWARLAHAIRGRAEEILGQPFIEGARAVGCTPLLTVTRHVLPQLLPNVLILGALEMGRALLFIAQLGVFGIYIGGGMQEEVLVGKGMMVTTTKFPEWGQMLASTRMWIRVAPWVPLAPALAFTLAILTFNLLAEGLRIEWESYRWGVKPALVRLWSRIRGQIMAWFPAAVDPRPVLKKLAALVLLASLVPLAPFRATGGAMTDKMPPLLESFRVERALADLAYLTDPACTGRLTGSDGARRAADYIVGQMRAADLVPGGKEGYFTSFPAEAPTKAGPGRLEVYDASCRLIKAYRHRLDFSEIMLGIHGTEAIQGELVAVDGEDFNHWPQNLFGKVILLKSQRFQSYLSYNLDRLARRRGVAGVLLVQAAGDGKVPKSSDRVWARTWEQEMIPTWVTPEVAAELEPLAGTGARVHLAVDVGFPTEADARNIVGVLPGGDPALAGEAIVIAARYDGPGDDWNGTRFPGASMASGVAVMLELARVLAEQPVPPRRSVVFVAYDAGYEKGARVYTGNPPMPLSKTILYISLVSPGTSTEAKLHLNTRPHLSKEIARPFREGALFYGTRAVTFSYDIDKSLDNFIDAGVPSAVVGARRPELANTLEDTPATADRQKMTDAGRLTLYRLLPLIY